ncbi:bifunctional diaminohydroxyphosphoribosylaminopyrimidine deaminase/5-amino-6-(5-phosphoribosylamino)uracil reductase RibD [Cellulomonas sp. APG4]|uniref:bifunctional diaminohydroxyphosphoribosylaminopyrimidine deaminase/5-amino-6-(5-phosphoribosylamino)uracil reductase RibD n=1 Tax=Cellulomonas sp. APG4 TaxID=1538656 RepID=UPI00137B75C7|nr:bifunctional diaminohydroxyphosphoribosylaminopyrimidine deaminase/5-amino-6-(5-phosphoribosylamino)uracil reductase RibD [Cellulomonas sp. APG4]NCT90708.1 bifunctional diaminohydroxyphosphoribosylaminopyrimidine deaminase/5-amino-6-(5-phosphoribosylamino)uracil reductase RibD [Cellulomonas sp. APG4]
MLRALELARRGPAHGPNPRVGCVLLDADGAVLAEGWHAGAGSPHAEAAAVADARARGVAVQHATAVVTLEPCAHTGRTGPCSELLAEAGVRRVVHAVADPNPVAGGGADALRSRGVDVVGGVRAPEGEELLRIWLTSVRRGRPWVTVKTAQSLDGRVAAADGSSRWITSEQARLHAHRLRGEVDAVVVGTGTVLADDPALTARTPEGTPAAHQPLRVVVGERDVPQGARMRGPGGELLHLRTRDLDGALRSLAAREVRHVLVDGGPTLVTALLRAGLVDEVHTYVAPVLLGASGRAALGDLDVPTMADARRLVPHEVHRLGPDLLLVSVPVPPEEGP